MATQKTTNHAFIREWIEERGGSPAVVAETYNGSSAILRIEFQDSEENEDLEVIDWQEFFRIFEENKLALLYNEETKEGKQSRFNKFVNRES